MATREAKKTHQTRNEGDFDHLLSAALSQLAGADLRLFPNGIARLHLELTARDGTTVRFDVEGASAAPKPPGGMGGMLDLEHVLLRDLSLKLAGKPIDELGLGPVARAGAQQLVDQFGADIVFTSGSRTPRKQCEVMADNIVKSGNRNWITQTYAAVSKAELQAWIDAHPEAITAPAIADGLWSVMGAWNAEKQRGFSRHIQSAAFDLRPVPGPRGEEIKRAIRTLTGQRDFLETENGIQVWHVDFNT